MISQLPIEQLLTWCVKIWWWILVFFIAPMAASDCLYPILSLYEQTNFTIPSTEINTVKSFLLLLKVFLPLIVPQWCHLPSKNISETFKNRLSRCYLFTLFLQHGNQDYFWLPALPAKANFKVRRSIYFSQWLFIKLLKNRILWSEVIYLEQVKHPWLPPTTDVSKGETLRSQASTALQLGWELICSGVV